MHEGMIEIPSKFLSLQFKPVFHLVSIFARCEAKTQIRQRVWLEKSSLLRQPITLLNSFFRFASHEQIRLVENGL